MILIADSGSTKTDWALLDNQYRCIKIISTSGINPNLHTSETIQDLLAESNDIEEIASSVETVFFYGAGCSKENNRQIVFNQLNNRFPSARHISVEHDITACAYASYEGEPLICCILGTGSNACFFDGNEIAYGLPSLGYILADEGSGNALGKRIVVSYFYQTMPKELRDAFQNTYNVELDEVMQSIYKGSRPNAFLAGFSKFANLHQHHPFIKNMIKENFRTFIHIHIKQFKEHKYTPVYFVGSIAYYFSDLLKEVMMEENILFGKIIQKPISGLISYHKNFSTRS